VLPARAGALAKSSGGCAVDDDLHVVQRHIGLARRVLAPGLGGVMCGDIPTPHGQVDSAAVGNLVVDDDELLVVRRADG
jgi:hypothetical protein